MSASNYTRVAVVQLDYHPAALYGFRPVLEDPLGDPDRPDEPLLRDLTPTPKELGQRTQDAYLRSFEPKVAAILDHCRAWNVELVVFPEYSIPWQILEKLGEVTAAAPNMTIVAGTHSVDGEALQADPYTSLGWPMEKRPPRNAAVAPVLRNGVLIGLVGKISPNKREKQGRSFRPVNVWGTLPADVTGLSGELAVLICLDFLHRGHERHRTLVGPGLEKARLCAVPMLSPWHTSNEVAGTVNAETKRYGHPVLLANIASEGFSQIAIDHGQGPPHSQLPLGLPPLAAGEEGVLVADLDLELRPPGDSTRYDSSSTIYIRPFASATLVYQHTPSAQRYAGWVTRTLRQLADQPDDIERTRSQIAQWLELNQETRPSAPAARNRLAALERNLDNIGTADDIALFVRDVVLPPDVLPLPFVRQGLAIGVDRTLARWQTLHAVGFDQARQRLARHVHLPQSSLLPQAQRRITEIGSQVDPDAEPLQEQTRHLAMGQALVNLLGNEDKRIEESIANGTLAEAEANLRETVNLLRPLANTSGQDELSRALHKACLKLALLLADQQEARSALEESRHIDHDLLSSKDQLVLARLFAALGDPESSRRVLQDIDRAQCEEADLIRTDASISIAEQTLPSTLPKNAGIYQAAAWVHMRRGSLDKACALAIDALKIEEEHKLLTPLSTFLVLTQSINLTVWDSDWIQTPIQQERRVEVIQTIERIRRTHLQRWVQIGAPKITEAAQHAASVYHEAIFSPDPWSELPSHPPAHKELTDQVDRLAAQGNVDAALALLPATGHPWLTRFQHARILAKAQRAKECLVLLESLAHDFPDRAPIELLLGDTLAATDDLVRAEEHARAAFEQAPAGGYRCSLAHILYLRGRLHEAWQTIRPALYASSEPTATLQADIGIATLELGAKIASRADQQGAILLWRRLTEKDPKRSWVRLRLAEALFHADPTDAAAADEAWLAYQETDDKSPPVQVLALVGRLQIRKPISTETQYRVRTIAAALKKAHDNEPSAEFARIDLLREIGDDPTPNYDTLVETGYAQLVSKDEALQLLQQSSTEYDVQYRLYREGGLPLSALADLRECPLPVVLCEVWNNATHYFCADQRLGARAHPALVNSRVLLGATEFLFVVHLDFMAELSDFLASSGATMIVPEPAYRRIREDALQLEGHLGQSAQSLATRASSQFSATSSSARPVVETWAALQERGQPPPALPAFRREGSPFETPIRAAMSERFNRAAALQADTSLIAVSTELFANDGLGLPEVATAFNWPRPQDFQEASSYLRSVRGRLLSLSDLVRLLEDRGALSRAKSHDIRTELARQGFGDSLTPQEIVDATTVVEEAPNQILDGLESHARAEGHLVYSTGVMSLAQNYSAAIVHAFLGPTPNNNTEDGTSSWSLFSKGTPTVSVDKQHSTLTTLLSRLEALDRHGGSSRFLTLMFVAIAIADRGRESFSPANDDPTRMIPDRGSAAAKLWLALERWAGEHGPRRTAFDRALCSAWVKLDKIWEPEDPRAPSLALLLANTSRPREWSMPVDLESIAILSANWDNRPLQHIGDTLSVEPPEGPSTTLYSKYHTWENLLERAATDLDTSEIFGDGRTIEFGFDDDGTLAGKAPFQLPAEAVVLRMDDTRIGPGIEHLRHTQGANDGIADDILAQLQEAPTNRELRRRYARYSVDAWWRQIRDDPSLLLTWTHRFDFARESGSSISSICRMLHEPNDPVESRSLGDHIRLRVEQWGKKPEAVRDSLFRQTTTIPGAALIVQLSYDNDTTGPIEQAIYYLEHPDDQPAGLLAENLRFLTLAARLRPAAIELNRGTVRLTELVPELVIRTLEKLGHSRGEGLGRHELSALRTCATVIRRALRYTQNRTTNDHLWLTYRLYAWFVEQLGHASPISRKLGLDRLAAAAPTESPTDSHPRSPFDPLAWGADVLKYRTVVFFGGLFGGLSAVRSHHGASPNESISSPALERWMLDAAVKPCAPPPPGEDDWMHWPLPLETPDLAAYWLLQVNPKLFFSAPAEHLVERLRRWPTRLSSLRTGDRELIELMGRGLALSLAELDNSVHDAFEAKLLSLERDEAGKRTAALGLAALYARGRWGLADTVRQQLDVPLQEPLQAPRLAFYFEGLLYEDEAKLMTAIDSLLTTATQESPPFTFEQVFTGLARVAIHADEPSRANAATAVLQSLAQRPELCDDPHLKALVDHLAERDA